MLAQNSLFDLPSLESVIDRTPLTASANTLVSSAIALMSQAQENRCELLDTNKHKTLELSNREGNSCLLIVEAGKLVGIFTERDVVKLAAAQRDLNGITLAQVMTKELVTLKRAPNQTILTALSLLDQHRIRHLPILDAQEHLAGLITQTDLLQAIAPAKLLRVVAMLQQQVGEKMTALEQEISRREQAEAELKQINDRLEMQVQNRTAELTDFIENAVVPMHWITSDGKIAWANQAELDLLGYAKEEYIGRSIVEFHADRPVIDQLLRQLSNNETVQNYQARLCCKDGSIRHVLIDSNVSWHNGEFLHTRCFTRDVSEQQQVEQQLQATLRSLEFQKSALDRAAIVAITDTKGIITYVNERFCQISKYAKAELIGQTHRIINSGYHPAEFFQELWTTIAKGKVWQGEIKNRAKDGSFYWVETTIVPFLDETGKPFQYLAIRFDISEQQAALQERKQAESALRQSEQKFRAIFDGTFAFIGLLTTQGILIEANRTALEAINAKPADVIGLPFWQAPWWSHSPQLQQQLQQAIATAATGELVRFEAEHILANGISIFVDFSLKPVFDDTGKVVMLIPEGRDISDRKHREVERQQAEIQLREISNALSNAVEGISRLDTQGRYIFVNEAYASMVGYTVEEMIGMNWQITVHSEDLESVTAEYQQMLRSGKAELKTRGIRKDGSIFDKQLFMISAYNEQQEFIGHYCFAKDISERQAALRDRKQAEQKIREQAALLDLTTDGIIVRDLESKIQFWNQGATRIYGWQTAEIIGQNLRSLLYKEISPQIESAYATVLEQGEWQGELRKVTKTGKEVIVASRWTLVKDEADNPKFILSVDTDITEQKLLEAQFLRAQRMESLGTLAGGVAHDLNNILAPILGFSKLLPLKLADADEQTKEFFKIIETNAQRGAALVKQILTFSRGMEGERGIVQVRHLITEIKQIIEETFPKAIQLETNVSKNLWTVNGDVNQLHQVLMNLVVNARDAMPQGGKLTITAENFPLDANFARRYLDAQVGSYIVITVTDTGVGIPAEIIERIFEPFFTTKEVERGTGLGLSTLIGIVKSHAGFVDVVSNSKSQPRGTQFKVFLPASETAETNLEATESIPQGNGELILVVDDEPSILEVTKATLEIYNYQVLTASNGIEAIALYAQNQNAIKLVIMDIMMPSMDGKTAIRILKTINSEAKIIAVSGLVSDQEIVAEINGNINAFVAKPYSNNDLLKAINEVVNP